MFKEVSLELWAYLVKGTDPFLPPRGTAIISIIQTEARDLERLIFFEKH